MTRDELLSIAQEPNVRAFLMMIRACEGTAGENGYRMLFGGEVVESLDDHPKRVVTKSGYTSSAAGAYQFLSRTWATLVAQYEFPSFEPQWQDAGAVALIAGRGALELVRAGRLEGAIAKVNAEWASLPGAPYNQPTRAIAFCRRVYEAAGGRYDAGAPIENRTTPETAPHTPDPEVRPMAPFVAAAIPALIQQIPALARIFGSGSAVAERNIAAAEKVVAIVQEATATPNAQSAVEAIQSSPDARAAAAKAVEDRWYELSPGDGGGVEGSRKFAMAMLAGPEWAAVGYGVLVFVLACGIVFGGGMMIWSWMRDSGITNELKSMLVGALLGYISAVVQWMFGSSVSSRRKDAALIERR